MKALIEHLWRENREQIVERSRWNCHARGVHSIVFLESPGRTIRCFTTTPEHELHLNRLATLKRMSIGFHPHHCNLTLSVVHGAIRNWEVVGAGLGEFQFRANAFQYHSALAKGGKAGFEFMDTATFNTLADTSLAAGDDYHMPASALHTVAVRKHEAAAWFVFEGQTDVNYQPVCFSGARLDRMKFGHLYTRPTENQIATEIAKLLRHL